MVGRLKKGLLKSFTVFISLQLLIVLYLILQADYLRHGFLTSKSIRSSLQFYRIFDPNAVIALKDAYYKTHYQKCQYSVVKENAVNCGKLFTPEVISSEPVSSKSVNKTMLCNIKNITKNCQLFRQINGYDDKAVTKEEEEFPLAFGIRIHTSPHQAEQLLRMIYRPQNFYCFHVDYRSHIDVFESMNSIANCFTNVVVLSNISTIYSSIRLVEADLLCMKEALKSGIKWKYYMNMAGQEIPIKTNLEIVRICQLLDGLNDISTHHPSMNRLIYHHKLEKTGPNKTNVTKQPFDGNITFRKGSAYGMLCRDFVHFAVNSNIAKKLLEYLADTYAPEETFMSTLNYIPGTPGGSNFSIAHRTRTFLSRAMIWHWDRVKCSGRYRRSVCVFNNGALPWIAEQPQVILNKVDANYDQIIIDCLEEYLHNKTQKAELLNFNYTEYQRFPHISTQKLKQYTIS